MERFIHLAVIISMWFSVNAIGDERIKFDVRINNHLVCLVLDTGAEGPILFRKTAERLRLDVKEPSKDFQPVPGKVKIGISEECRVEFGEVTWYLHFGIVDLPSYIQSEIDGVIGWGVISQNILEIHPASKKIKIHNALNIDTSQWLCLNIRKDLNLLVVQVPKKGRKHGSILIDTGSPAGVSLNMERWQSWIDKQSDQDSTLSALFYPGKGLLLIEETWAKKLTIGGLTFTEVPVRKGVEAGEGVVDEGLDAILGLNALSCFSWIVDGATGKIYIKPNDSTRIPENYDYNRLGAVFVPHDIRKSNALIAHVVDPGPAYSAGIRDGDVLLKIDDLDVTGWRTDPSVMPLSRFWEQPAGTKLNLVLMRNGKKQEVIATLQEIFKGLRDSI